MNIVRFDLGSDTNRDCVEVIRILTESEKP